MLKKNVLRKNSEFSAVYNKGKSVGDRYVVLFYRPNGLPYNRTGFLASKKVGNSVVRHHLARLIREGYRLQEELFHIGYDVVIIVRVNGKDCTYHEIERAIYHLGKLHQIVEKKNRDENSIN